MIKNIEERINTEKTTLARDINSLRKQQRVSNKSSDLYRQERINQSKLNALNALDGYPEYFYMATLLDTNVEGFRKALISNVEKRIEEAKDRKNELQNRIKTYEVELSLIELKTINNASDYREHEFRIILNRLNPEARNTIYLRYGKDLKMPIKPERKNEIKVIIMGLKQKIAALEEQIQRLERSKEQTKKATEKSLRNGFVLTSCGDKLKFDESLKFMPKSKDEAFYNLMQTKEGYDYLQYRLDEIKRLEQEKNRLQTKINLDLNIPENVRKYIAELGIYNYTIFGNIESLSALKDKIEEILKLLNLLKSILIDFNPRKFISIDVPVPKAILAGSILKSFNFDILDIYKELPVNETGEKSRDYNDSQYFRLTKWLKFDPQAYNPNLADKIFEIKQELAYIEKILQKDGTFKILFSRKARDRKEAFEDLQEKTSEELHILVKKYITYLYTKTIERIGSVFNSHTYDIHYLDHNYNYIKADLEEFITGLETVLTKVTACLNTLLYQKELKNREIRRVTDEIGSNSRKQISKLEIVSSEDNIFESYERAFLYKTMREIEEEIISNINNEYGTAPIDYAYRKIPVSK